jgi:hypothetical protein
VIRPVRADEYEAAGRLVLEAHRSLGDEGDEFYDHELADVAGRAKGSDVLVAELDGQVVGSVTFVNDCISYAMHLVGEGRPRHGNHC